jgi:hypothetical protein
MSFSTIIFVSFIIILIVIALYQYLYYNRQYYVDSSISKFRELRHEALISLSEKIEGDTQLSEIEQYHDFLSNLDAVIENFKEVENHFTRFDSIKVIYRNIIFSSHKYDEIKSGHLEILNKQKTKFINAISDLFRAIPFFNIRMISHLTIVILSVLVRLGFKKVSRTIYRINNLDSIERRMIDDNNCFS